MKICSECGTQLPEDAEMCPSCGAPTELPVTLEEANEIPAEKTYEEVYEETYVEEVYEAEPENQIIEPIMDENSYLEYEAPAEEYVEPEVYVEQEVYEEPTYTEPVYTETVQVPVQTVAVKQKSGGVPIIVVIILMLLTLSVSLLISYIMFGGKDEQSQPQQPEIKEPIVENNNDTEKDKEEEEEKDSEASDDKEPTDEESEENDDEKESEEEDVPTEKVELANYELKIPTTLSYEADKEQIKISDKDKTWSVIINTSDAIFSRVQKEKDDVKGNLESNGYEIKNYGTKTYNDYDVLVFEVTKSNQNNILAYSYLGSAKVAVYTVFSQDGSFNYDALKEISQIVKNAKTKTTTTETSNSNGEVA